MESLENNNNQSNNQEIFLLIEKNIYLGNQKSSKNRDLLNNNKINHILLIGNELEPIFKEV